ncbi:MAG: hypothetical protein IJT48_13785, partial [Bacteroidaceae bacterium]|nr:hypothetical protein [Bacteroidaceae bacterium]
SSCVALRIVLRGTLHRPKWHFASSCAARCIVLRGTLHRPKCTRVVLKEKAYIVSSLCLLFTFIGAHMGVPGGNMMYNAYFSHGRWCAASGRVV